MRSEGNLGSRVVGEDSIFPLPENNWSGDKEARGLTQLLPVREAGGNCLKEARGLTQLLPEGKPGVCTLCFLKQT